MKRTWIAAMAVVVGACQPSVAPVQPIDVFAPLVFTMQVAGRTPKPNLMFLVGRSASMNLPIDASAAGCPAGCGVGAAACPASCPTRLSEVVSGLNSFLDQNPTVARLGLAVFPDSTAPADACKGGSAVSVLAQLPPSGVEDFDLNLPALATHLKTVLGTLTAGGDAPIASALDAQLDNPNLRGPNQQEFVILIADSLPGCGFDGGDTEAVSLRLSKAGIRTVVVGFGPVGSSTEGRAFLNPLAQAGGFARVCPQMTDAECGANNACDQSTGICHDQFYAAQTGVDLSAVLDGLASSPTPAPNPCVFNQDRFPTSYKSLTVRIDGAAVPQDGLSGGWSYSGQTFSLNGEACTKVTRATSAQPAAVELQFVPSAL